MHAGLTIENLMETVQKLDQKCLDCGGEIDLERSKLCRICVEKANYFSNLLNVESYGRWRNEGN